MRRNGFGTTAVTLSVAVALLLSAPVFARDKELEARVVRLENMLNSRGLVDLFTKLEQMQREVQQLRGEIEMQGHTLEQMQKRQRDLYLDIDRRMQQFEPGSATGTDAVVAGQESAASATEPAPESGSAPSTGNAPVPIPVADPVAERKDYESALDLLREGRYEQAAKAYREFLQKYPGSGYAANAQYWLAETYYVTRRFKDGLPEFERVLDQYPSSQKAADAQLKVGFILYELEQWADARAALGHVIERYPGTTAARLAQERLQRMAREGR